MGALIARGTTLNLAGSPITGLTKTDGPKINGKLVDITNHGSPTNFTESLGTVVELSWSCTLNFDPTNATHVALRALSLSQNAGAFTYTKAGETTTPGAFSGFVKSWSETEDPDKQRVASFDLTITGTFTPAVH